MEEVTFKSAYPIGDIDINALPVKDFGQAIGYYTRVLGFSMVSRSSELVVLRRGDAQIGLQNNNLDPEQISCYFEVSPVENLREEVASKSIEPSAIRIDKHNGKTFRVILAKEPYGVCFCFGEEVK